MHSYLLFHSLAEIAAATISVGTFLFAWNTRRFQSGYLLTLGAAALFVGLFEVLHCLAFPGMAVFPGYDEEPLSAALAVGAPAPGGGGHRGHPPARPRRAPVAAAGVFAAAFVALCAAAFLRALPAAVGAPQGLTPFKVAMEWGLVLAFAAGAALLYRVRARFAPSVFRLLFAQALAMAACEFCFTLYLRPYDLENLLGHVLLLVAGSLQYLAILRAGLQEPSETLFRDLTRAKERLERAQTAGRIGTFEWDLKEGGDGRLRGHGGPLRRGGAQAAFAARGRVAGAHPPRRPRPRRGPAAGGHRREGGLRRRVPHPPPRRRPALDRGARGAAARRVRPPDPPGGVNMDVTALKQVEEELRRSSEALREADRNKTEFIGVLSHELRNPLAAVRNSVQVLARGGALDERGAAAVAVIDRQVEHLGRMIDDLLDVTRISRGKVRLQLARVDLPTSPAGRWTTCARCSPGTSCPSSSPGRASASAATPPGLRRSSRTCSPTPRSSLPRVGGSASRWSGAGRAGWRWRSPTAAPAWILGCWTASSRPSCRPSAPSTAAAAGSGWGWPWSRAWWSCTEGR
jgi:hypothetical protein